MKLYTTIHNTKFSFDLLLLILFFFLPNQSVIYIIVSIFFHELGHYIVANILKYNVTEFRISILTSFVQFEEKITNPTHSFFISLSGVFMNLLLLAYAYYLNITELYSINTFLVIINLLPLRTVDGNYALKAILDLLKISNSQKISDITGIILSSLLIILMISSGNYIIAAGLLLMTISLNISK